MHLVFIYSMHSIPSTLPVSVFVFITYSWHLTRTGSAAPGFGKKEQVVDEQVFLTHLHGSTRKNKRERVEIAKGKGEGGGWEWRGGREGSDVFLWMRCVMQLADCLLAVPQSSRHASPADSALWKEEREGRNFSNLSDIRGMGIAGLSLKISQPVFHIRDSSGVLGEVLEEDVHTKTLRGTAYASIKSCLCGCWNIQQHSFIPQTRNVRPFLAKASCSQTSHCLQGDEQNACTRRVSKWERVYGPCRFSI